MSALAAAVAIDGGGFFTCALTSAGGVRCWGDNEFGTLGDNSGVYLTTTPVDVEGLSGAVAEIAAGDFHACVRTQAGGVKCWGNNFYGQVGDGTTTNQRAPVDVSGLGSGVFAIAAGRWHSCAVIAGGARCWGENGAGQLGDNTLTSRTTPVDVIGLGSNVTAIAAGDQHTCALTSGGGVKCWGSNFFGQLGDTTNTNRKMPVDVEGLGSGVIAIAAAGFFTCALTSSGAVKCWGWNEAGQLGGGSGPDQPSPVDVAGLAGNVTAITTGFRHACALSGVVQCWGRNEDGELGDGTKLERSWDCPRASPRSPPAAFTPVRSSVLVSAAGARTSTPSSVTARRAPSCRRWKSSDCPQGSRRLPRRRSAAAF
jgi:hypothetical protein